MATVASIIAELRKKGTEKGRIMYARHGMRADLVLGVSIADLKVIARTIKGEQALACELYGTGVMEAMYLAGMVADGSQMSRPVLEHWAKGAAELQMVSEYTVPWVALESPYARELALKWMKAKQERVATAGWCTYSGIVATIEDRDLDLAEIERLLAQVVNGIGGAPNRVRHCMNNFVIAVGTYVAPLFEKAMAAAREIGEVSVDMGDTACKIPLAAAGIQKAEAAGKVGKKRKTIRC